MGQEVPVRARMYKRCGKCRNVGLYNTGTRKCAKCKHLGLQPLSRGW